MNIVEGERKSDVNQDSRSKSPSDFTAVTQQVVADTLLDVAGSTELVKLGERSSILVPDSD